MTAGNRVHALEPAIALQEALVQLGTLLLSTTTIDDYLCHVADLAAQAMNPPATCGVSLYVGSRPITVAASGYVAGQVEETQYEVGAGPCVHAMSTGEAVEIRDLAREHRWPDYCTHALSLGLASTLSLPLTDGERPIGAVNIHARTADAFDADARRALELFAAQASAALELLRRATVARELSDQLRDALGSRAVIDQAMGIVIATRRCSPDEAFAFLRRTSQNANRKVRDVATDLVAAMSSPPSRSAPPTGAERPAPPAGAPRGAR